MLAGTVASSANRAGVGPGAAHHAGRMILCRPVWRLPWLAAFRVLLLLLVAGAAKVLAVRLDATVARRVASDAEWPALVLAVLIAVHPVVLRRLFVRTRSGTAVAVSWCGRDRSGQPWLVLRSADGRAWRARPRQGPVEYPVLQFRGTPWLYPPAAGTRPVPGTLVRPRWTHRRGLVLHAPTGPHADAQAGDWEVIAFGSDHRICFGLHLRALRRLALGPSADGRGRRDGPRPPDAPPADFDVAD